MPTLLTHPAVPLALGLGLGTRAIPPKLLLAGVIATLLPDLDVLAFKLGIPYGAAWGHRGFSHALLFAVMVGALGALGAVRLGVGRTRAGVFLCLCTASHGALDALTNGGMGVAFLLPWSDHRYFAPFRPIQVSPLGVHRFFTAQGLPVLMSELQWVWLPLMALAFPALAYRLAYHLTQRNGVRPARSC